MESGSEYKRSKKRQIVKVGDDSNSKLVVHKRRMIVLDDDSDEDRDDTYLFKVLLPNGTSVGLTVRNPDSEMPLEVFIAMVKEEYLRTKQQLPSMSQKRGVHWRSNYLYLEDENDNKLRGWIKFRDFKPHKSLILRLHDGSSHTDTFENMWDLTPDTDLLAELPEEYNFETALADLIDNCLQAVWDNPTDARKLIRIDIADDKISIFDTGPGMDGSEENCIVKWGKMGASLHRIAKRQAIGGQPPYLKPFFGLFGYGGPIASMHLGRHALVSSKTVSSKKVYTLRLEREALLNKSGSQLTWRTDGGIRSPLEDESESSPHGSFTKVEIFEPRKKDVDAFELSCKLKDIYFPYIQCDDLSKNGNTSTPVVFEVNGTDLAEIEGREIAVTNLHSCNGPEFVLQVNFSIAQEAGSTTSSVSGSRTAKEANARLRCVYFPIIQGKENIERILEKLDNEGHGVAESYETFSRVSIRRLGRLLPDARWARLAFMEPKPGRGDRFHLLKRCCSRVKCFIETDAGFYPTPSKTDLAQHNPFTTALKNLGRSLNGQKDVHVKIYREGKLMTPLKLEKEYHDWILQMHKQYDEETGSGEDQPLLVINPPNKDALGISSDVVRVHTVMKRKDKLWQSGQRIKILKGACTGFYKNNVYATLEHFLVGGLPGDAGGEARIICRPMTVPEEDGCKLSKVDENPEIDIQKSQTVPIGVIDSGKLVSVEDFEWENQLEKQRQKLPVSIDLLRPEECKELNIDGALPIDGPISAGQSPPQEIVAVLRPASLSSSGSSKKSDQKFIVKDDVQMIMEVKFIGDIDTSPEEHVHSVRVSPSSLEGSHGLYVFQLGSKFKEIFKKAGVYRFLFSTDKEKGCCKSCEKKVTVHASAVDNWKLLDCGKSKCSSLIRVGSPFPPLSIACYDCYENRAQFTSRQDIMVKLLTGSVSTRINQFEADLSPDRQLLKIEGVIIESDELDLIRPEYMATLVIGRQDESVSTSTPFRVLPGHLHHVLAEPSALEDQLFPGSTIDELKLEMFDVYGNHVAEDSEIPLILDGFQIEDQLGSKRKVDINGFIDLSGLLKVVADHGSKVSLSVLSGDTSIFTIETQTVESEREMAVESPVSATVASVMENDHLPTSMNEMAVESPVSATLASVKESDRLPISTNEMAVESPVRATLASVMKSGHLPISTNERAVVTLDAPALMNAIAKDFLSSPEIKDLEADVHHTGLRIGQFDSALQMLKDKKDEVEQFMMDLQVVTEPSLELDCLFLKEEMQERIKSRKQSAAYVISKLSRKENKGSFMEGVVGIVALLGTVSTIQLSRILAKYLGEDQMLAVVCRSYKDACRLERYELSGEVDRRSALHAKAAEFGVSVNGQFVVMCLKSIRPYNGEFCGHGPERKLKLQEPGLPTGEICRGFVGHAVNLIDIENDCLVTTTELQRGLRETLFYRLFGKLQVYDTRENMIQAMDFIEQTAVSLDGGILRENGVISLGYGEPEICFPVVRKVQSCGSPQSTENLKLFEEKRGELLSTLRAIKKVKSNREEWTKQFKEKTEKLHKLYDNAEPLAKLLFEDCAAELDQKEVISSC